MRTNIEIDDDLMAAAMKAGPYQTKKAAVEAGLKLLARQVAYREILKWRGKLRWEGDDSVDWSQSAGEQGHAAADLANDVATDAATPDPVKYQDLPGRRRPASTVMAAEPDPAHGLGRQPQAAAKTLAFEPSPPSQATQSKVMPQAAKRRAGR